MFCVFDDRLVVKVVPLSLVLTLRQSSWALIVEHAAHKDAYLTWKNSDEGLKCRNYIHTILNDGVYNVIPSKL